MKIKRATKQDEKAVRSLWSYCFEKEGSPFFDWYFAKSCRMEDVLLGVEGNQIACDLHLRPYTLSVRGKVMETDYIVGVATHPAARGRGCARELLAGAFRTSRAAGKAVDILMPSDASFYRPQGFGFYAYQWQREAAPARLAKISKKPVSMGTVESPDQWQILAGVYDAMTARRTGYTLRDETSWRWHIDAQLQEGYIAYVCDEEGPAGYLFYSVGDGTLTANEMAYKNEAGQKGLYAYMAGHLGSVSKCSWQEPLDDCSFVYWQDGAEHTYVTNRTFPYMMARLTDPAAAFNGLAVPADLEGNLTVRLSDPVLPELDGLYTFTAGRGVLLAKAGGNEPSAALTIAGAAQLLFGAMDIDDLTAYGEANAEEPAKPFLRRAFPRTNTWVNEWY